MVHSAAFEEIHAKIISKKKKKKKLKMKDIFIHTKGKLKKIIKKRVRKKRSSY